MKKVNLITLVLGAAGIMLGFSSCKKCVTCTSTYSSGVSTEDKYCKGKDMSRDDWQAYIRSLEDSNTVCK